MIKERTENERNLELKLEFVEPYSEIFLKRFDLFSVQSATGVYRAIREPITPDLVEQHFRGDITLGAYALDANSCASWICYDADSMSEWEGLIHLSRDLANQQIISYLELSRRGGHLWLFLDNPFSSMPDSPISGREARRFAKQLISSRELDEVEIYPKQDVLRTGPGSLVRLPLGVHRKTNHRYHFIDHNGQPIASTIRDQIQILSCPERVPASFIGDILAIAPEPKPLPSPPSFEGKTVRIVGDEVSERIKNRISVYDFVSQFVDLDRSGRGLCPFHDDHQVSFSVDMQRNYWQCFAGCGGYTVIDFWMKWQSVDFKQAVKELAAILL